MFESIFPKCGKCETGYLVPLSDTSAGNPAAPVMFKAWVCSNPKCGFNIKFKNGEVIVDAPTVNASTRDMHYYTRK